MKFIIFFLISLLILQVMVEAISEENGGGSLAEIDDASAMSKKHHPHKINCSHACARRCSKTSRNKVCKRACNTCCARCNCVPPGTYGNKEHCPCYANMKTHGNKPKCP